MKKTSNTYIITYAAVMIVAAAVLLALAATALAPRQQENINGERQRAILAAIGIAGNNTAELYKQYIVESYVVDNQGDRVGGADAFELLASLPEAYASGKYPVFVARVDSGDTIYILPVQGKGLWGSIWGYVALESDWDTIYGVKFDHASETPGLGAEISGGQFADQFKGKRIFSGDNFVSIALLKGSGSSAGNANAVDAISGGTLTSRGVQAMLRDCLSDYLPLIEKEKSGNLIPAENYEWTQKEDSDVE